MAGGLEEEMEEVLADLSDLSDAEGEHAGVPLVSRIISDADVAHYSPKIPSPDNRSPIKWRAVTTDAERVSQQLGDQDEDEYDEERDQDLDEDADEDEEPEGFFDEHDYEDESDDPSRTEKLNIIRQMLSMSKEAHPTISGASPKPHILARYKSHDDPTPMAPANSLTNLLPSLHPEQPDHIKASSEEGEAPIILPPTGGGGGVGGGLFMGLSGVGLPLGLGASIALNPSQQQQQQLEPIRQLPIVDPSEMPIAKKAEEPPLKRSSMLFPTEFAKALSKHPALVAPSEDVAKEVEAQRIQRQLQEERALQEERERIAREKEREMLRKAELEREREFERKRKRLEIARQKKMKAWEDALQRVRREAQLFAMKQAFLRWHALYIKQKEYEEQLAKEAEERESTKQKIYRDLSHAVDSPFSSSQTTLERLLGVQAKTLNVEQDKAAMLGKTRALEWRRQLREMRERSTQKSTAYWSPLDLPMLLFPVLSKTIRSSPSDGLIQPQSLPPTPSKQPTNIYWKLLLAVDKETEGVDRESVSDWLTAKLSRGNISKENESESVQTLSLYSVDGSVLGEDDNPNVHPDSVLHVCVSLLSGYGMDEKSLEREGKGSSALLFVVSVPSFANQMEFWEGQRERLALIVESFPSQSAVPLLVLYSGRDALPQQQIADNLRLRDLPSGTISGWRILRLDTVESSTHAIERMETEETSVEDEDSSFPFSVSILKEALGWLSDNFPRQPDLESATLRDLLEQRVEKALSPLFGSYYRLGSASSATREAINVSLLAEKFEKEKSSRKDEKEKEKEKEDSVLAMDTSSTTEDRPNSLMASTLNQTASIAFIPTPASFILRYNTIVENTRSDLTADRLKTISWPALQFSTLNRKRPHKGRHVAEQLPDFDWNSEERLDQIAQSLNDILIDEAAAKEFVRNIDLISAELRNPSADLTREISATFVTTLRLLSSFNSRNAMDTRATFCSVDLSTETLPLASSIKNVFVEYASKVEKRERPLLPLPWHRVFELITSFLLSLLDTDSMEGPGAEISASYRVYLDRQSSSSSAASTSSLADSFTALVEDSQSLNSSSILFNGEKSNSGSLHSSYADKKRKREEPSEKKPEPALGLSTPTKLPDIDIFARPGDKKRRRMSGADALFLGVVKQEQYLTEELNESLDVTAEGIKTEDIVYSTPKRLKELDFSFEDLAMNMKKRASLTPSSLRKKRLRKETEMDAEKEKEKEKEKEEEEEREKERRAKGASVQEECEQILEHQQLKDLFLLDIRDQQKEEEEMQRILNEALRKD